MHFLCSSYHANNKSFKYLLPVEELRLDLPTLIPAAALKLQINLFQLFLLSVLHFKKQIASAVALREALNVAFCSLRCLDFYQPLQLLCRRKHRNKKTPRLYNAAIAVVSINNFQFYMHDSYIRKCICKKRV